MRISDWSSDVCSSDLATHFGAASKSIRLLLFRNSISGLNARLNHRENAAGRNTTGSFADFYQVLFSLLHQAIDRRARDSQLGLGHVNAIPQRSEERRVGKECVSTCRTRW